MKTEVIMETVDTNKKESGSVELCKGEIPGARAIHHVVKGGEKVSFAANAGYYHIVILIQGNAVFATDGKEYPFDERMVIVPSPEKELVLEAKTDAMALELQWDIAPEDTELLAKYNTTFPVVQPYATSIQYIDPNKSEKTISRMMIPHEIIPRFTIGSVESWGYDYVRPHSHPMLDQFFFSFPENDMDVIINGENIPMKGNIIMHIPLGADHGVEVVEGKHMHYMWIDFIPDNELGLQRLNSSHKPTGKLRSFDEENK